VRVAGTKMVVLDALATFVGENETPGRNYQSFLNQEELEHHCSTPGNGCDVSLIGQRLLWKTP